MRPVLVIVSVCLTLLAITAMAEGRTPAQRREDLTRGMPAWRLERREQFRQDWLARVTRDRWTWPMLLDSGDRRMIKRGNAGLRDIPAEKYGLGEYLLAEKLYGDRIEPRTRRFMREGIRRVLADPKAWPYGWPSLLMEPKSRRLMDAKNLRERSYGSHVYFAAMAGVLGGEVMEDPALLEAGRRVLRALVAARNLAGEDGSYNSPNYTPWGLTHLANLADLADDPESRRLARWLFARRMLVYVSRYHPPSQQMGGPNQRGYVNTQLGIGKTNLALNDNVIPGGSFHDIERADRYDGGHESKRHLWWMSTWRIPDYVRNIATEKAYPYEVQSSSWDRGYALTADRRRTFEARRRHHITYLTKDYVLGTTRDLSGNQPSGNHFIAQWPRRQPVEGMGDFRLLWSYYSRGDEGPFQQRIILRRGGIFRTVQHQNKALVIYHLKDLKKETKVDIDAVKLVLLLTAFEPIEELRVGEKRVTPDKLPITFRKPAPIYLSDGSVYAAILPLEVTDFGRPYAMRLHMDEYGFLEMAYYNYKSKKITLALKEMHRFRSGFAFEIAGQDEFRDFAAFRAHMAQANVRDETVDGTREAVFESGSDTLRLSFDSKHEKLLARQVNGEEIDSRWFRSPDAVLAVGPEIAVGHATLESDSKQPLWLVKDPRSETYAVWNHSGQAVSFTLRTPVGSVEASGFGTGHMTLRGGKTAVLEVEQLPGVTPRLVTSEGIRVEYPLDAA